MMKFLVKQQKIEVLEREIIASDQIAFVSVRFVFDGAWKVLHKVVQFTQCEETYNVVLGTEGTTCLEGVFSFAKIRKRVLLVVRTPEGLTFPAVNRRCQNGSAENHG